MFNLKRKEWNLLWAILAVGVFFLVCNLMTIIGYMFIPQFIQVKPEQAAGYMFAVDLIISIVLLALSIFAWKKMQAGEKQEKKSLSIGLLIQSVVFGAAVFGINTLLNLALKPAGAAGSKESLLSMILTGVIFAALIEECFFRGVVYRFLNRYKSGWFSIVLSAVIFGLYHADPYQALYTTILGIVLAFVYQKTGNLLFPILIHMTNNLCGCIFAAGIPENVQKGVSIAAIIMIVPAVLFVIRAVRA